MPGKTDPRAKSRQTGARRSPDARSPDARSADPGSARPARGVKTLSAEDIVLWAHVAAQVRPLPQKLANAVPAGAGNDVAGDAARAAASAIPPPATQKARRKGSPPKVAKPVTPPAPPPAQLRLPAIDRRTLQRLRRGLILVEDRLDLHGHTQDSAHAALATFLQSASRSGKRTVLVITGKGSPSPGGEAGKEHRSRGVLRRAVPRWLQEPVLAGMILGVAAAAPDHGGGGALYLQLRRAQRGLPAR